MPVNIAMISTGRIADHQLAPALSQVEGARLWSVHSRDAERGTDFARRHGAASPDPVYTDLDALLCDPELDAVIIATPDKLHAAQTIAAARAGKHVLVEKPMATETADALAMTETCREAGVKLGIAYHMRWHAGHRALAAAVHGGELGEIRHMRVIWTFVAADASNWRATPDVGRWWGLAGVGTHCLDQIRWLMLPSCGEVTSVESVINRSVFGSPHDETAALCLQFESGATAEVCTSVLFAAPGRMEVYGGSGHVICDATLGAHGEGRIWGDDGERHFVPVNPYAGEIRDFVEAVTDDRDPEVTGEEGTRNVELLVAAVEGGFR